MVWTGYGAACHEALRAVVAETKTGAPLAPVTVLVPTQLCGMAARRTLARGIGPHAGVAGLSVLTVDRLAEQVAVPALVGSGRRPVTGPVLVAACRQALATDPGLFGPVRSHGGTVRALAGAYRELREIDGAGLDAIAGGGPVAADLVRMYRRIAGTLAQAWYDTTDLRRVAAGEVRRGASSTFGTVVLFVPQDLPSSSVDLLAALGDVKVVTALAGDPGADEGVLRWLPAVLGGRLAPPQAPVPTATRVLHASDADDEVRCAVRLLVDRLSEVPAHRVAVLYGSARPYARLLAEHLSAAGIRTNGPGVRPTAERAVPRTVLDVLALPDQGWRRDALLAVVSSAPVRGADDRPLPASRWDRISRAAGVVAGSDWETRLADYATGRRREAEHERAGPEPRVERVAQLQRDAAHADDLRRFVADLQSRLDAGAAADGWPALAGWVTETLRVLFGDLLTGGCETAAWIPEEEVWAANRVGRILDGLAGLDAVEAAADLNALRMTLELELAEDLPRQGRFGTGVLVAPLSAAVGLDLDLVLVVGLAEDVVPGRPREDALLPDRIRDLPSGQLRTRHDRIARQHRHLLAALAAAPERVVSFPRGDLRRGSIRLPSRWLLPTLRALAGEPRLAAGAWQSVTGAWLAGSASYADSLTRAALPATEQEWRIRAALVGRATSTPEDPVTRRAAAMLAGRAQPELTRFDGNLTGHAVPDPAAADQVVSPTALEDWVACPHAYFLHRMLWVRPNEAPEELVQISTLDIGNLVHEALDRFFTAETAAGTVPTGRRQWTKAHRQRLRRVVNDVAAQFETRGVTGHRLLWRQELHRIHADLDSLLDVDDQLRAKTGRRQVRSELTFGQNGVAPVQLLLADGRVVRFRGSADRVDRAGDHIVVVDYKTGGAARFTCLTQANPTGHGAKLQLPVYAQAARAALAAPQATVSAEYWFLRRNRGLRVTLPLTPAVQTGHAGAVATIVAGIAAGLFPHRPPDRDGGAGWTECRYCDPDGLGVAEHRLRWRRKQFDPRLDAYRSLIDPSADWNRPDDAAPR